MSRPIRIGLTSLCLLIGLVVLWHARRTLQPAGTPRSVPDGGEGTTPAGPFQFSDIARPSGIDFTYFRGETGDYWITETTGGGVALVDYDGDGWIDILVTNGCRQPPDGLDQEHTARLFHNQHDGTFAEVTLLSGVAHSGYGQGCFSFDYDNDGFDDLYITCWGPNVLYHNNGDGTFRFMEQPAKAAAQSWSTGAVPGDFDRDGNIDLLVVNYVDFDYRNSPRCGDPRTGTRSYCGPDSFAETAWLMLRNRGDGSFDDVSSRCGILAPDGSARPHAKGLGAVAADFDDDGWLDIYVANDKEPNFLFLNRSAQSDGTLFFEEAALDKGVATNQDGAAQDSMGVACGDYDGDGRFDLLVTNFYLEGVTLYKNLGRQGFIDATRAAKLLAPTRTVLGWGAGFFDFDNDGWLDLFTANGHVQSEPEPGVPYSMPAQLFHNMSGAYFEEVTPSAGGYFRQKWNGRGAAFGDIDNDGRTDIVVVHHHQPLTLLHNDTSNQNHWLRVTLLGRRSDRGAVGARIDATVEAPAVRGAHEPEQFEPPTADNAARHLVRQVSAAGSYLSSNDPRILLGLGQNSSVRSLEIRWPSGCVQLLHDLKADQDLVIREPTEFRTPN